MDRAFADFDYHPRGKPNEEREKYNRLAEKLEATARVLRGIDSNGDLDTALVVFSALSNGSLRATVEGWN